MQLNPITSYIKYLILECYEEDYDPYNSDMWYDNYCYEYTFVEWYFLYRKKMKSNHYKHTPIKLIIGADLFL
jgi:hypothetical protein